MTMTTMRRQLPLLPPQQQPQQLLLLPLLPPPLPERMTMTGRPLLSEGCCQEPAVRLSLRLSWCALARLWRYCGCQWPTTPQVVGSDRGSMELVSPHLRFQPGRGFVSLAEP